MIQENNTTLSSYHIWCRDGALICSVISILLGLSGLIGWYMQISSLVQYQANTVSMVFNTALCFVVMGVCLAVSIYQYTKIMIVGCGVVFVISGLSILQDIYSISLGIDEFFFKHHESVGNVSLGRMSPNTSLCFLLSAFSLLVMSSKRYPSGGNILGAGMAFTVLCLNVIFFLGYFSRIPLAYHWGNSTPIAMSTSIQFIVLSLGLASFAWYRVLIFESFNKPVIPLIFSTCIVITFCMLSYQIYISEEIIARRFLAASVVIIGFILALMVGFLIRFAQIKYLAERKIRYTLSMVRATLESTVDGILVVNKKNELVDYNQAFISLWHIKKMHLGPFSRYKLLHLLGKDVFERKEIYIKISEILNTSDYRGHFEIKLKNGTVLECHCIPQILDNNIVGRVWNFRDITAQKKLIETLSYQATHDSLTGLPNRALLIELIDSAINKAKEDHKTVAICLLDLDRFTHVNDVFGRSKGDELLVLVAQRIQHEISKNHILGRFSGDEFVVIGSVDNQDDAMNEIEQLLCVMSRPYDFYHHQINTTVSIGAAFYPYDGEEVNDLLSKAAIALFRAKKESRNSYQYYKSDMETYTLEHIELEHDLRQAIENNELELHYQPLIHLESEKIVGFEALVRWNHSKYGLMMPAQFIPLAEETGYVREIGDWVFRTACQQLKRWHDDGYAELKMAINVSRQQFIQNQFVHTVKDILFSTKLSPDLLELELTETALFDRTSEIIDTINACHQLKIRISLDDFGTGFSCLNYLKTMQIDTLKIDQSFVQGMMTDKKNAAIVKTIIDIGKNLGISILAEGIETLEQKKKLKSLGCEFGQGYYFSRPLPVEQCLSLLKSN